MDLYIKKIYRGFLTIFEAMVSFVWMNINYREVHVDATVETNLKFTVSNTIQSFLLLRRVDKIAGEAMQSR